MSELRIEEKNGSDHSDVQIEATNPVDRDAHDDDENYHGLTLKIILVFISLNLISGAQILNLIGAGAFSRDIAGVVGGSADIIWMSSAITILTCVLGPPVSQAADYWGRKWFLVILTSFGLIGSIITSRATSMGMAIGGQVVTGISFGSQPLIFAVGSEIMPRRYRPLAQGALNCSVSFGGIFAILVGFALTQNDPSGFRTFWYISAGVQGFAAITCALLYNPAPRPLQLSLTTAQKLGKLDWVGYALLAAGVVLFTMALSWSQNPYPWTDAHVTALFLIGVAFLFALGVHQWRFTKVGMFHHGLFKRDRNFALAVLCLFVEGMVFFSVNSFYVFELNVLYESNLFMVGVRFSILFLSVIFASVVVSLYSSYTKTLKLPTVSAFTFFLIYFILMSTATLSSGTVMWFYTVLLGFGLGICVTILITTAQLSAPPALISISTGVLLSVRSLGGSIGLAIYNAVFNAGVVSLPDTIAAAVLPLGLPHSSLPAFIEALAGGNIAGLSTIPGVTPDVIGAGVLGLQQAYLVAFRYVWVTSGVFTLVAVICAAFILDPAEEFNMHVDAPLDKGDVDARTLEQ